MSTAHEELCRMADDVEGTWTLSEIRAIRDRPPVPSDLSRFSAVCRCGRTFDPTTTYDGHAMHGRSRGFCSAVCRRRYRGMANAESHRQARSTKPPALRTLVLEQRRAALLTLGPSELALLNRHRNAAKRGRLVDEAG